MWPHDGAQPQSTLCYGLIGFRAIRLMNLGYRAEEGAMMIICENVCGFATFELSFNFERELASQ